MLASHHSRSQARYVLITASHEGQRIDNFLLVHLKGVPKTRVYRIIRKGEIRVNKRRVEASYRLIDGDSVRIPPLREGQEARVFPPSEAQVRQLEAAILYEDNALIILNKPAGVAVHGGSGIKQGVIEILRASRATAPFLELVHRLDRDTSGCLMIAKKRSMLVKLHDYLKQGRIQKRYWAVVHGSVPLNVAIEAPLLRYLLPSGERRVAVSPEGKFAKTGIKILESFGQTTLLEASPITGRTHQIRVHCAHAGHPIVGDEKYGHGESVAHAPLFLHARKLTIPGEVGERSFSIEAPLPEYFEAYLADLRMGIKHV